MATKHINPEACLTCRGGGGGACPWYLEEERLIVRRGDTLIWVGPHDFIYEQSDQVLKRERDLTVYVDAEIAELKKDPTRSDSS